MKSFVFVCAFLGLVAAASAQGPIGAYYLTAGDQAMDWRVQGAAVVNSWAQVADHEYPIAINNNTVKTMGWQNGLRGGGYTLAGVDTGSRYTNTVASGNFWDGTSDGIHNYAFNFGTGDVYQFDANWATPSVLFNAGAPGAFLGITYDRTNNSLWLSGWNSSTVEDVTLGGAVLSSFSAQNANLTSLAMDVDNTLWMGSQAVTWGTFFHYSRAGAFLGQVVYAPMSAQNTLGGEINVPVPEPATLAILGLGILALRRRKR